MELKSFGHVLFYKKSSSNFGKKQFYRNETQLECNIWWRNQDPGSIWFAVKKLTCTVSASLRDAAQVGDAFN